MGKCDTPVKLHIQHLDEKYMSPIVTCPEEVTQHRDQHDNYNLAYPGDNAFPVSILRIFLHGSRYLQSQKLRHIQKNIPSWVENECSSLRTVDISNVNFVNKISTPPEPTVEQTIETPVIWDVIGLIMTSLQWKHREALYCFLFPTDILVSELNLERLK